MAALPLYGCRSCAEQDAMVFCSSCDARLCLPCDNAVHISLLLQFHTRAVLCAACGRAAAVVLGGGGGTVALCDACSGGGGGGRVAVPTYTGCPGPAEMASLVGSGYCPPEQQQECWLAADENKMPRLVEDQADDQQQFLGLLPTGWNVAMETARLERMLMEDDDTVVTAADEQQTTTHHHHLPQTSSSCCGNNKKNHFTFLPPPQSEEFTDLTHAQLLRDQDAYWEMEMAKETREFRDQQYVYAWEMVAANTRELLREQDAWWDRTTKEIELLREQDVAAQKREYRERAKQRYIDKKKTRRYGKRIVYACRKAGADKRQRIHGRFAHETMTSNKTLSQSKVSLHM